MGFGGWLKVMSVPAASRQAAGRQDGHLSSVLAQPFDLLLNPEGHRLVAPTPRQVFDVTGAGDTVLAVIAMAVTAVASWSQAMQLAAEAAGRAIGQMGSVAVWLESLRFLGDHRD